MVAMNMLSLLRQYEKLMVSVLMIMMAVVLGLATLDLGWMIVKDVITAPYLLLDIVELLDIFGLFMLVLIGIELLETIMKTYLIEGKPHFEVVLSVAIIAIARKVIILDVKEVESLSLFGIADIVIDLTAGYFLMKRSQVEGDKASTSR
jgi:uncharacterized membrane protein (DUF373 family)